MKTQNDKESNTKQTYFRSKEFSIIFIFIIPLDQSKGFFILYALFIFSTNTLLTKRWLLVWVWICFRWNARKYPDPQGDSLLISLYYYWRKILKQNVIVDALNSQLYLQKKDPSNWMDRENFAEF